MYKAGDYLVYKRDVCKVMDIIEHGFKDLSYYVLMPLNDKSLKLQIPITIDKKYIRDIISKEKLEEVINLIPTVDVINADNKLAENEYKKLLHSDSYLDLIKIIKTTYLRNKERVDNKKKVSDKDKYYFEKAERYLYSEFSIVLDKSYEETKDYVVNKVKDINK